jgi:hypothetical protein
LETVEQIVSRASELELTDPAACHDALVESAFSTQSASQRILLEALIVLVDFQRVRAGEPLIANVWRKLKFVIQNLPYSEKNLKVFNCDARALPIEDRSVELVITSPPYINVFNYHQQYRASAEGLGWNLLTVAKSEIGSNRKHRANRFLTVIQYCLDITIVLCELSRVCKPSARVVFVVGRESRVRGVPFFNGELAARLATGSTDLRLSHRQERVFKNRFGENIVEDILHLTRRRSSKTSDLFGTSDARAIAKTVLERALQGAEGEVAADIEEAIASVPNVEPSPMYTSQDARTDKLGDTDAVPHAALG